MKDIFSYVKKFFASLFAFGAEAPEDAPSKPDVGGGMGETPENAGGVSAQTTVVSLSGCTMENIDMSDNKSKYTISPNNNEEREAADNAEQPASPAADKGESGDTPKKSKKGENDRQPDKREEHYAKLKKQYKKKKDIIFVLIGDYFEELDRGDDLAKENDRLKLRNNCLRKENEQFKLTFGDMQAQIAKLKQKTSASAVRLKTAQAEQRNHLNELNAKEQEMAKLSLDLQNSDAKLGELEKEIDKKERDHRVELEELKNGWNAVLKKLDDANSSKNKLADENQQLKNFMFEAMGCSDSDERQKILVRKLEEYRLSSSAMRSVGDICRNMHDCTNFDQVSFQIYNLDNILKQYTEKLKQKEES